MTAGETQAETFGMPSGIGSGVDEVALGEFLGGPAAAKLAQDKEPRELYGVLTERDRRSPFNDGDDEILCSPRSNLCRPLPLIFMSGDAGEWVWASPDDAGDEAATFRSTTAAIFNGGGRRLFLPESVDVTKIGPVEVMTSRKRRFLIRELTQQLQLCSSSPSQS